METWTFISLFFAIREGHNWVIYFYSSLPLPIFTFSIFFYPFCLENFCVDVMPSIVDKYFLRDSIYRIEYWVDSSKLTVNQNSIKFIVCLFIHQSWELKSMKIELFIIDIMWNKFMSRCCRRHTHIMLVKYTHFSQKTKRRRRKTLSIFLYFLFSPLLLSLHQHHSTNFEKKHHKIYIKWKPPHGAV